ncbi:aspartate aminotransferase family protein [Nesterenkonia marinintestina]|uniref:aspartate aminotransferase family protein n=1 Tax=Nesterenkonia marinintestina TaxID=2979865 RepID=UPI0021BFE4CF|nr:aspartate aminotransferase family protein [Nesterenkonia sp. GX14115]
MSHHQQYVGTRDPRISDAAVERGRRAYELDRSHVFHSWSAQRKFDPMTVLDADGSWIWDGEGRPLLDLSGQLVFTNIGHKHPRVVQAIQEQAATLPTIAPQHVNDARSEAARLITERLPESIQHVFFTNAGAESNDHAVRMARLHTGRHKILSSYLSYHGATRLTSNLTGSLRRVGSDQAIDGVVHFHPAYTYRSAFGSENDEQESERALAHLRDTIELEGPSTVAAVILEAVPGTAGIFMPPPGYMAGVAELCREHGIVLIMDEVMVGFGRVGEWFGHQLAGISPDIVTFAKGVNSGYVPLGGVAMSGEIYESFAETPYPGGLTYSGHPLACAAAVATINAMEEESMVENARRIGEEILGPRLREIAEKHPSVGEVRGAGAFWAVELVKDQETRERLAPMGQAAPVMGRMMAEAKSRGLLMFTAENRFHLCPPLNISDDDLRFGLDVLDEVLRLADEEVAGG